MKNPMPTLAAHLFCALLRLQDEPARQSRDLVEKLRSDKIEEREEAIQAFRSMGERALPLLRKAQEDADPEIRGRIRDVIVELEWRPVLPVWLPGLHPRAFEILTGGNLEERRAFVEKLAEQQLLPPCLAERIVLGDGDPEVRVAATRGLTDCPRPRTKAAYVRLLGDLPQMARRDQGSRASGSGQEFFPTQESFLEAFQKVLGPSDRDLLRPYLENKDVSIAGAAEVLSARIGGDPARERLVSIVELASYPVAALAREELARRFGPEALRSLPAGRSTFARWRSEEADLTGLLANGSPEAIRALEERATKLDTWSSQGALRLLAKAGTEPIARALFDLLPRQKENYQKDSTFDALRSMPPKIVLKILKERSAANPEILVRFTIMILFHGDEEIVTAYFRVKNTEPANLYHWAPPTLRPEVTPACRRVLEEPCAPWAIRYAYTYLSRFDPEGRAARTVKVLKDPKHPAFPEALADVPSLPEAERRAIVTSLVRLLDGSDEKATPYALGRTAQRELIDPLLRRARKAGKDIDYNALYALVDMAVLTDQERLEIARETGFSYMWDTLQGRLPRGAWDDLHDLADKAPPHVRIPIAKALISSGDTRPFPSLKERLREYPWGLAAVRALTEGESCAESLMKDGESRFPLETQAAGEIVMALSAFQTPAVENFLLQRLESGPIRLEMRGSSIIGGYDPNAPPADAVRALVNLRSPRYRKVALQVARTAQGSGSVWHEAVEALGILNVEGGLQEVVSWLEDAARTGDRDGVDAPYLEALGYLGDERHLDLARGFLKSEETRVAAARALDRLVHRAHYGRMTEVRALRRVRDDDPAELARLISKEWGLEVRLPDHPKEALWNRSHGYAPVLRGDGFQLMTRLSSLLNAAPLWKEGHVEFLSSKAIGEHWTKTR